MANLFGKNKLRAKAQQIETDEILDFVEIVKTWHHDYHNGSLKKDKETSREQAYNQDFFIKILGYKEKPAVPYSFEPKATTEKGQLPDAVISYTDTSKDITNIAAVVELKGAAIDFDRPQRREGNMSPVQQGFKYKTQYRNCPFVIVSNFWEFRLYHDNLLDYEVWTLDDLVNPDDDYIQFKMWFTLFKRDNFTISKGSSKTEDLLSDIRFEQEEIGKKFYKRYRDVRLDLLRDIYKNNDQVRSNIDLGIEKAQKIIDRIVFAAFAEDRGLLPDDTLRRVIKASDNSAFGGSLWSTFKSFFEAINTGSEKLEIPHGYNGGLFAHDAELNNLKVSDKPLREVAELSNYNFEEDLSVTILGHIFEQSISDLEEIKNKVSESQDLETIQQSRRKKDGIFYTPDYIVRYIVDNSLGAYLREAEEKFKDEFKLHGDINDKNYEKRERQAYSKYQEFLQNIKVVDPACGSGAFLVYVFDYLLAENKRVESILGNSLFSSDDYIKEILRNNIYGVDLNEESVEITKLSLWLKSAQKGKKLTSLDDNIKCGNSLIDDTEVAGDKAFDWQKEFPKIFADGGFDVVVGNPPWVTVNHKDITKDELEFYRTKYKASAGFKLNLYPLFVEKTLDICKTDGIISLILPNRLLDNPSYKGTRELVKPLYLSVTNVPAGVFEGVVSGNVIVKIKNTPSSSPIGIYNLEGDKIYEQDKSQLDDNLTININGNDSVSVIIEKIDYASTFRVGDIFKVHVGMMIKDKKNLFALSAGNDSIVTGRQLERFGIRDKHTFDVTDAIIFGGTKNLVKHKTSPKIFVRKTGDTIVAAIDNDSIFAEQSVYLVLPKDNTSLEGVVAILNSKLSTFYFRNKLITNIDSYPYIQHYDLVKIPLPSNMPSQLTELSQQMSFYVDNINKVRFRFEEIVGSEFDIEKWPNKLNRWWTLDFTDFVKALKVKLSLQQKDELLQLFEKYRKECADLDAQIQKTDHEIDQLVYKLYNLTPEEIKTIEES